MKDLKSTQSRVTYEALHKPKGEMSRRDALKVMGLSAGTAMMLGAPTPAEAFLGPSSDKKVKVTIVGGNTAGIMIMARVRSALPNAEITLISPNKKHLYQAMQTFIAAGLGTVSDMIRDNKTFIPDDINWIVDEVAKFNPDNNNVVTRAGKEVTYDYMIVAIGTTSHYDGIKGLSREDIGKNDIASIYLNDFEKGTADGGNITWEWVQKLKKTVADGKKPTVIFTMPNTPITCGGAPQKIMYMTADYLKKDGLGANFIYATARQKIFSLPSVEKKLLEVQGWYETISNKFGHNLVEIDTKNKIATFEHRYEVQGEHAVTEHKKMLKIPYDFIHVVAPESAPKAMVNSVLAWQKGNVKGWLEVDSETLQHRRYKNVFGVGDVCGIPMGKTGGSARHHAKVVVENLVSAIEGKPLKEKFDGYTVCPLKVAYGKVIMAEFNYKGEAASFPFLAVEEPRYLWWVFDLYMLKPMYWHLMLRGWM